MTGFYAFQLAFPEGVALWLHPLFLSQVIANSRALGARLMKYGYKLVTDGTDNHLVLWDMRKEVKLTYVSSPSDRADVCNQYGLCTLYRGHHDVCV